MSEEFPTQDDHRLSALLREWRAPDPPAELDGRVRSAWRAAHPAVWRRIWTARIHVPVPVFAVLLLLIAALLYTVRPAAAPPPPAERYITRVNATGFRPLPNGEAKIVRAEEIKQ
jgi:hypothetical protein